MYVLCLLYCIRSHFFFCLNVGNILCHHLSDSRWMWHTMIIKRFELKCTVSIQSVHYYLGFILKQKPDTTNKQGSWFPVCHSYSEFCKISSYIQYFTDTVHVMYGKCLSIFMDTHNFFGDISFKEICLIEVIKHGHREHHIDRHLKKKKKYLV